MTEIFWCKTCLNMSTRPRITFNKNGVCIYCDIHDQLNHIYHSGNKGKEIINNNVKGNGPYTDMDLIKNSLLILIHMAKYL